MYILGQQCPQWVTHLAPVEAKGTWQDGKCVHCKYLPLSPYKPLEKFSKALYGTKGGTYSARIFRPVMAPPVTKAMQTKSEWLLTLALQQFCLG